MNIVINKDNEKRYTINNYNLKVLKCDLPDLPPVPAGVQEVRFKDLDATQNRQEQKEEAESVDASEDVTQAPVENDQSELIDSLLKKADDFSSKYLKAQMQYEELLEQSTQNEEKIRQEAYEQGYQAAKAEALETEQAHENRLLNQLEDTIKRLEDEVNTFHTALRRVEEELVTAALEIAKEVILKELSENSSKIAMAMASNIIQSIEKDSQIKIKVNPKHYKLFEAKLGKNKYFSVEEDKAVVEGGVIVISQSGTIEADIMKRYENAKKSILKY